MDEKLYVLVRKDLTISQQAVQAGHAVAEFLLRGPNSNWSNGTLVYLGIENVNKLRQWCSKLKFLGIPFATFKEPDLNNEETAIAVANNDRLFKSLNLLV